MFESAATPSPWISIEVLLVLFAILGASSLTFWVLVRRSTSRRQWVALSEWSRESGLRMQPCQPDQLPSPLRMLAEGAPVVRLCLADEATVLAQIQTPSPPAAGGTPSAAGGEVWNLLVRRIGAAWRPTGMRPAQEPRSVLDLYSLSSFPMLGTTERFVVYGTDSADARALSESMARSLLPPDVGLLLHGDDLLLDFSGRPFDVIEFNRMLSLADQLADKLPSPT